MQCVNELFIFMVLFVGVLIGLGWSIFLEQYKKHKEEKNDRRKTNDR
jgi:ABC-type phosphate transport system permease subunit